MRIIEGFETAKAALSRQAPFESYTVSPALKQRLTERFGVGDPEQAVRQIINEVRHRGDAALFDYTLQIDGIKLASLEVSRQQIARAQKEVDPKLASALKLAAERIRGFYQIQKDQCFRATATKRGSGQRIRPLERVGVYVPGGTAAYPSTVLMSVIPAKVAGVKEVILVTPPKSNGAVPPATLVAAGIAKADRVFAVGGAQAIAALAFGTKSIPRVDKICGPGNIFVTLAKKLVYGAVGIDGLQGPSEVLIVADETASPAFCAAELLAQAEHDPLAAAILITDSRQLASETNRELTRQLKTLPRRDTVGEVLKNGGMIAVVASIDEALEVANAYAPEHLCLWVDKADNYVDRITNAGCVFIGIDSTVVLGDYVVGPSHVLPTAGTARFSSPLNILDFIKIIDFVAVEPADLKPLAEAASTIARAEGLEAHARAAEKRLSEVTDSGS